MKNYIILFLFISSFFNSTGFAYTYNSSVSFEDGRINYNIDHEEKYYCPQEQEEDNFFGSGNIYSPSEDCSIWNNFGQKYGNEIYQLCLSKQQFMQEKVNKGLCDKIIVEKYEKDGAICEFEVTKQYKKIIGTTCINGDLNLMKNKFTEENDYM